MGLAMRVPRRRVVVAGCAILIAVGLTAGYLWQRDSASGAVANLQSAPVGDTGVTYVTWDGKVALVVWKDFVLT